MGSEPYRPGGDRAGFEKLSGNKYMAPITGIVSTQQTGQELGSVGIPESVFQMLEGEGHLMDRVAVAKMGEETLGQYSGKPARVESVEGLYGAIVPDYAATATDKFSIQGGNGIYQVDEWEEEPARVCITFPDDDTPMSLQALEYQKIGEDDVAAAYHDRRDDEQIIRVKNL